MSQWRQKRKHQTNRNEPPTHNTISSTTHHNLDHNTSSGFHNATSTNRNANTADAQRQWHSKKGQLDFTHRSNRYRQYYKPSNNRQNGYYDYSSNSNNSNYGQRRSRNYDHYSTSQYNKKQKQPYASGAHAHAPTKKINPKYLMCPQPRTTSLRVSNLQYLREFPLMREKACGMNVKCYITQNSVYFIDAAFNVRMLTDVFYGSHGFVSMNKPMLFDGELFVSERTDTHSDRNIFYRITDCIAFDGQSITHRNSSERYQYIDEFMRIYRPKLKEYAEKRSKVAKRKNGVFEFEEFGLGDEEDTPQRRLVSISTLLDHKYQHTKYIKDEIIHLCKSTSYRRCDDHKTEINDNESENVSNGGDDSSLLDDAQLNAVSVVFTRCTHMKVTKHNLQTLSQCIQYSDDSNSNSNSNVTGYYYSDPHTGIKSKSEGILFIPEKNNYLMDRDGSEMQTQKIWKPVDLLTVDIKIMKLERAHSSRESATNDDSLKEMDAFIDGDKLDMLVYNDEGESVKQQSHVYVWFNCIDMGKNDVNDGLTPFWNEWHLKQRSTLSNFISVLHQQRPRHAIDELIVECNYDFNMKSWSLFKLKVDAKRPSSLKTAQDIISQMEEYLQITDLIRAVR